MHGVEGITGSNIREPGVYQRFVEECEAKKLPIPPAQFIQHAHHHWLTYKDPFNSTTGRMMVAQWSPQHLCWYHSGQLATMNQPIHLENWVWVELIPMPVLL